MTWITPRQALQMIGQKKLAQLTNEAGQQEYIGTGDGQKKDFTTPFIFGLDLKVYTNAVLSYTVAVDFAQAERLVATFPTAPSDGAVLTASSTDAVNADNFDSAFLRAQGDVRGMVDAALYETPADDATDVHRDLIGWAAAIAWYYLASDPRRPRLLEAYPEIEKRYMDVYGGIDATLNRVAKARRSLRGVLPYRGSTPPFSPPADPTPQDVEFSSRPLVYAGGKGVF